MITLALTVILVTQESPDRLRDAFPLLQEAWKALTKPSAPTDRLTDESIRGMGKLAAAFEAAGVFSADAPTEARALKRLLVHRAHEVLPVGGKMLAGRVRIVMDDRRLGMREGKSPLERFEKAVEKQGTVPAKEEDRLQEVLVEQRKALQELGVTYDALPQWQRRRILTLAQALATGGAYPAPAKATLEQEKQIRELIGQLSETEIEKRDAAVHALEEFGELMVPFVREALAHTDMEIRERAKGLLGIGVKDPEIARTTAPQDDAIYLEGGPFELIEKAEDK